MTDPRRGTAVVSLIWAIALAVLLLFAILFGFMQAQLRSEAAGRSAEAAALLATERQDRQADRQRLLDLTAVVGFAGAVAGESSSIEAVQREVDQARNTFPSARDARTLQEALGGAFTDYGARSTENRNQAQQIDQLRNDLEARQREFTGALREKDGTINQLRGELEDLRTSSNAQLVDLERQRDGLRAQVREAERQASELRLRLDERERQLLAEGQRLKQRNDILSERLDTVGRQQSKPDGRVLAVSAGLRRAWVDRGRLDRIRPGMEFEARNRTTGRPKGRLRVVGLEDRRSEVEILAQPDPFDPVSADDAIYNDLYDPDRVPVAVLLGNGFSKLTQDEMRNLLTEVGIRVDAEVTAEADYLILGTPFFDPDTGEQVPWPSHDAYKAAESLSVQIVPFRDAMVWLGL